MVLGDKLRTLRKQYHYSQKDIAERLGVTSNSVSKFENDTMTPSFQNMIQFALIYNVSLDYLVGLDKNSYLYLYEFNDEQRAILLQFIQDLKEKFDYNKKMRLTSVLLSIAFFCCPMEILTRLSMP